MLGFGRNAVWLTTKTTREFSVEHKALFRERRPDLYSESQEWLPDAIARLRVRIPSHDKKLFQYLRWRRKNPSDGCPDISDDLVNVGMKEFWFYLGVVRPERIDLFEDVSLASVSA